MILIIVVVIATVLLGFIILDYMKRFIKSIVFAILIVEVLLYQLSIR